MGMETEGPEGTIPQEKKGSHYGVCPGKQTPLRKQETTRQRRGGQRDRELKTLGEMRWEPS